MFLGAKRFDPGALEEVPSKRTKIEHEVVESSEPPASNVATADDNADDIDHKNKGIIERYKKTLSGKKVDTLDEVEDEQAVEIHDVAPLPKPTYKAPKAARVSSIPKWMKEPEYISLDTHGNFDKFGLSSRTLARLQDLNFSEPFPVQTAVVPQLIKDIARIEPDPLQDVLVNAYTGSGKTLAYGLPIVEALATRVVPRLRALIILPTKPLIQQVRQAIEGLAKGTPLRVMILRTERSFPEEQQLLESTTPDILITTPGRLVDHIRHTPTFTLEHLRYFVIDEADKLLNQSFQRWVDTVMDALPKPKDRSEVWARPPQKLIFSATLTRDPGKLAPLAIHDPRIYVLGSKDDDEKNVDLEFSVPEKLEEKLFKLKTASTKPLYLAQLLHNSSLLSDTIVFVKSNEAAGRLALLIRLIYEKLFSTSIAVERCSGELELAQRKKVLRRFANKEIGVLICTDLIARGVDIEGVKAVINYDLPKGRRDYVHRVGRTARAGNEGTAISLVCSKGEIKHFESISKTIKRTGVNEVIEDNVDIDESDEIMNSYQDALKELEDHVFNRT